ncbi:hypothetical protein KP509_27G008800 [Ceratopteris richardii]|nr:hypothetical protein KP509_27G008800 [Ceratopteris richardii]
MNFTWTDKSESGNLNRDLNTVTEEEIVQAVEQTHLGSSLDLIAFTMRKCAEKKNHACALRLYELIHKHVFSSDPSIGPQLILMLLDCGCLHLAEREIKKIKDWDEIALNTFITAIVKRREPDVALPLLNKEDGAASLNSESQIYVEILKVCAEFKYLEQGSKLHAYILDKNLLESEIAIGNTLISMYAKCDDLIKAQNVFDELPARNVVSWNALLAGYARQGLNAEVLARYQKMQNEGIPPNAVTYLCILKACCGLGDVKRGQDIYAEIARKRLLKPKSRLCNMLMDMYVKSGLILKAHEVFDTLANHSVVAWNTLISGYNENGRGSEALQLAEQMQSEGVSPDAFTFACILKACGLSQAIDKGLEIHAIVLKKGLHETDFTVANALVDMYAKCGSLLKARAAFDSLPFRDVISWTSLISGYAEHGPRERALRCFDEMQQQGVSPNAVTYLCILKACGHLGAVSKGSEIHLLAANEGSLDRELLIGSTLVDMYAKFGLLQKAEEVFKRLYRRDVISWNALLAGYAQAGESEHVFLFFDRMRNEGTEPNLVTLTILLNACNHLGLVDKGLDYCMSFSRNFTIIPTVDHFTTIIDLLGRSGQLEKVIASIDKMHIVPDIVVWLTILSACRKWKTVEIGRWAFKEAMQLDCKNISAYICMSLIYLEAGMHQDVNKIEALRLRNQANNDEECCFLRDVNGLVRNFTSSTGHSLQRHRCINLENICNEMNKKMSLGQVPNDVPLSDILCKHTERDAVAFALTNTCKGTAVYLKKNVRVCDDCHSAIARLSELEQRKIVIEDSNRHHVFERGKCTCNGYW